MTGYGRALLPLWPLEPGMIFLNHGSYGATPRAVLAEQRRWQERLEANPCRFFGRELPGAIRAAAGELAAFLGVAADDLALVENTTTGVNAVLRSLRFAPGEEVVVTDHVYNAVRNTLRFVLDGTGATLRVVEIGLPAPDAAEITRRIEAALGPATRLVLLDHVASASAVVFPVAEIARSCARHGVPVLVDGAHAPGMLDLDVGALGVTWYVGNGHKWLCAPKGAAFLWTSAAGRDGLHPTVISHDLGKGFTAEFDKIGTRDPSSWLAVPAALAFHAERGGAALRARNRALAAEGAALLADRLGTRPGAPPDRFGSMATIRLPDEGPPTRERADHVRAALWDEHRIEAHCMPLASALWLRISIQAYNDIEDVARLAAVLPAVLRRL